MIQLSQSNTDVRQQEISAIAVGEIIQKTSWWAFGACVDRSVGSA
jgi:hypothetical protein